MTTGKRPETGPMKFGDDWTGVFFRGDDAIPFAITLENLLSELSQNVKAEHIIAIQILRGLVDTLRSANEVTGDPEKRQKLFEFESCVKKTETACPYCKHAWYHSSWCAFR